MEPIQADRWREAVQHLLAVRRPEQAEQVVRRHLGQNPQEAAAHELLALTLLNQPARTQEALTVAREAIALDPQLPDAHYFHSVALLRSQQPFGALQAIEEALRLNPCGATYFGYKAVILNNRQLPQQALAAAAGGLSLNPGHLECLFQRVQALRSLQKFPDAARTVQQLARWHPNHDVAHQLLGEEAVWQKQIAAAAAHFQEALRLAPDNARAQEQLAPVLVQLGKAARQRADAQAARAYFWQAWHLQPGTREVSQELEQLAQNSYWLKRQFLRLDAWWATTEQEMKRGKLRAILQIYLGLIPLMSLCCLPLLATMLIAAVQWRMHPDVLLLRQQTSRWSAVGEVALMGVVAAGALGLILCFRCWLDTASDGVILALLLLLAAVVGASLWRKHKQNSSSSPE